MNFYKMTEKDSLSNKSILTIYKRQGLSKKCNKLRSSTLSEKEL